MEEDASAGSLRLELKAWEKSFAAANGGRKPGREDIKRDAAISAKYKEYQLSQRRSKETHRTPKKTTRFDVGNTPLKERSVNNVAATPRGRRKDDCLPGIQQIEAQPEPEPTPAFIRTALGPTPQKDGQVLGIFDMLMSASPSKQGTTADAASRLAVNATPSKRPSLQPSSSMPELSRTPQSSSKRFFLDAFAGTPLKRKRDNEEEGEDIYTPATGKRQFATPSFLRRYVPSMSTTFEEGDEEHAASAPTAPPFKKRGLVKSLSTIIQGLRKQEEDRLDDEWDVMREMEAEEERGDTVTKSTAPAPVATTVPPPKLFVEDSQVAEMPLGPDMGVNSDDDEEGDGSVDPGALDANGNPRKVWKKKGLKRQTKRVKMKPVLHRPRKAPEADQSASEDDEVEGSTRRKTLGEQEEGHDAPDDNSSSQGRERKNKDQRKGKNGVSDIAKSKPKKVNPQAHANFRRLKIKNKNSKANGRGKRFGRR